MSKESGFKSRRRLTESSEQDSLPQQWGSVQKRLEYLETSFAKMQKKSQRYERRITSTEEEIELIRKDIKKKLEGGFSSQTADFARKDYENQFTNVKEQISQLQSAVKKIQRRNSEIVREIKNSLNGMGGIDEQSLQQRLRQKMKLAFDKNKAYLQKSVSQMQGIIKNMSKQHTQPEFRLSSNDLSRSQAKSRVLQHQKLSQKSIRNSQLRVEALNDKNTSIDDKNRDKSPRSISNNGNSRVSYLRERLREFQQINKKYEQKPQKKVTPRQQKRTVQKLKDFKNYLQQSESEIDQSNLEARQSNNVLTDSIKRWRNGNKQAFD